MTRIPMPSPRGTNVEQEYLSPRTMALDSAIDLEKLIAGVKEDKVNPPAEDDERGAVVQKIMNLCAGQMRGEALAELHSLLSRALGMELPAAEDDAPTAYLKSHLTTSDYEAFDKMRRKAAKDAPPAALRDPAMRANDARRLRGAMDAMPPRLRAKVSDALCALRADDAKSYATRFPNGARIKQ